MRKQNKGFTLLEILLVIAAIGILAAIVLVAINPTKQIESARSAQRRSEINSITKAIQQYSIDNNGQYPAGIETGAKAICNTKAEQVVGGTTICTNKTDLRVLVPNYIASIPQSDSNNYYVRRSNNNIEVSHPRDSIWNIGGTPSLDLNFAKNKSLIDGVSGNNLISFARNSTATYVGEDGLIKTAAANEARFDHNPTTRESLGLLVEEERTNLLLRSEEFGTTWATGNASVSSNAVAAPNGTLTADKFVEDSSASTFHRIQQTATLAAGAVTYSVYLKAAERNFALLVVFNGTNNRHIDAKFNLQAGTVDTVVNGSASITNVGNGWFRCSVTSTTTVTANNVAYVYSASVAGGGSSYESYTGDGTSGIYIWGAQLEAGAFPTSYIPTTGSTVTRSADVATITGSAFTSFYNQTEGTVFAAFRDTGVGANRSPYFISDGSASNRIGLFNNTTTTVNHRIVSGGASTNPGNLSLASGALNKHAITVKAETNGAIAAYNGALSTAASPASAPAVTQLAIGSFVGIQDYNNAPINRLTYWPTRLSNATLQSITQ